MGSIRLCRGDIFAGNPEAIAQGCNLKGAMGKGIACTFKDKFPEMYTEYHEHCEKEQLHGGDVFEYPGEMNGNSLKVYNLMTQDGFEGANINYLMQAMSSMCANAQASGIKEINMPLIGGGLGRVSPSTCLNIYAMAAENHAVKLNVVVQVVDGVEPTPIMTMQPDPKRPFAVPSNIPVRGLDKDVSVTELPYKEK